MNKITLLLILAFTIIGWANGEEQPYWIYDAELPFTDAELYMMENPNADGPEFKAFSPIDNPEGVPILRDRYATNAKCAKMFFPGNQYSRSSNFFMKCMSQPADQRQYAFGTEIWQAFSVFVPVDYDHRPDWNLIYQFHGHPDNLGICDNWRSPPLAIELYDTWRIKGRYDERECGMGKYKTAFLTETQPVTKGLWTHFVVHVNFDPTGLGLCEVWLKDGQNNEPVKIADYVGPLGFNDTQASYDYLSFGYYYGEKSPSQTDVTLFFDRILFGGPEQSLDSMMYKEILE